ncbi:hypothetical protein [Aliidiomarina maris]|uniref:Uncharacterized protein n=1 Tax=Aliidiomarina maris TaxID=531312 RepID=A0A327WSD6_9GAMM|nr:hypothetical protein [Aliidiomarina maris]RAJ95343.1 hypothetical protein B0I24_11025 [Aliidiomarina maris]RUO22765.1 hypothetical protein CWE07_10910 [Aliidiomarina maris]
MSATAKILSVLLGLATLFGAIFLIVYFALVGLVLVPVLLGVAYLLFKGIKASASEAKDAVTSDSPK